MFLPFLLLPPPPPPPPPPLLLLLLMSHPLSSLLSLTLTIQRFG